MSGAYRLLPEDVSPQPQEDEEDDPQHEVELRAASA
jgi:hypothetical protein